MINTCAGCGKSVDIVESLCERCFKLKHYGQFEHEQIDENLFEDIINKVNNHDLVLYLIDTLNFYVDNNLLKQLKTKTNVVLVLTKGDVLPRSVKFSKIITKIKEQYDSPAMVISSHKKLHLDHLYKLIMKHPKTYLIGTANAGKSTLINQLLASYGETKTNANLTVSNYPGTTLGEVSIALSKEHVLIDTPGIVNDGDISYYLDSEMNKLLNTKKEIKPINFQIIRPTSVIVEDFLRIDTKTANSLTFFMSNNLKIKRINYDTNKSNLDLTKKTLDVPANSDIIILGLGFINVKKTGVFEIYVPEKIEVKVRSELI